MANPKYDPGLANSNMSPEIHTESKSGSEEGEEPRQIELGNHPQMVGNRHFSTTLFIQLLSVLWLVPIVALLYLNFSGYIIGASAWCPGGHCWLDAFNPVQSVPQSNMVKYSRNDHDLLAGLQFVAKALEVWFCLIASALVYLITMHFAGKKEGMPVGYLTRPIEFAEVVSLLDPLLWMTGPAPWGANKSPGQRRLGRRVWFLIAFSVFLCVLCNLMGPATAVLVIPALGWIDTESVGNYRFKEMNAGAPPQPNNPDSWFWWRTADCTGDQLANHQYSCTQWPFGLTFDAWVATYMGSTDETGITSQDLLTFQANDTYRTRSTNALQSLDSISDVIFWAPSRQIISNMSTDFDMIALISDGEDETAVLDIIAANSFRPDPYDTYVQYNKSLSLEIHRNGPILGVVSNSWLSEPLALSWTVNVDANRQIICYPWYNLYWQPLAEGSATGNYTKCARTGQGWSDTNKEAHFTVQGSYSQYSKGLAPSVTATYRSSDKVAYFANGIFPTWLPSACLAGGGKLNQTTCDWDRLFTTDPNDPMANRTENLNTVEYTMKNGTYNSTFAVDFVAYLGFTEYSLDPSPATNPQALVQTLSLPATGVSIPVDPNWWLAAWSADSGGQLLPNRASTNLLLSVMYTFEQNQTSAWYGLNTTDYNLDYVALLPTLQTLSLIDFSTDYYDDISKIKNDDPTHPFLQRNARMNVWSYGVDTRTSWLGAIVAILGCLVVVAHVIMGFMDRRPYRSATQLLVAALEHLPRGEFEGKHHDEKEIARVRFHIKDDHQRSFSFYEPEAPTAAVSEIDNNLTRRNRVVH